MAAELIEDYNRYEVWQTKMGYFVKDKKDFTPIFYNEDYAAVGDFLVRQNDFTASDILKYNRR